MTANAIAQTDTALISREIDQITVEGKRSNANVKTMRDGTMRLSMDYIAALPKILGNADPVRYVRMLPGVQTNSDYDSGIHIQGSDNGQNYISVAGVPVYNAGHLLGFFSVFNPGHFQTIDIAKSPRESSFPNRLGGGINMDSRLDVADSVSGTAEVGLISSQGAVTIPVGKRQTLMLAARVSYLNLLYSNLLKIDESTLRYSFNDFNVRHIFFSNNRRRLYLDLYHGNDNLENDGSVGLGLRWGNDMAALHFDVIKPLKINSIIYFSRYYNKMDFSFNDASARMPSDISTFGIKADIRRGMLAAGVDVEFHNILPQSPEAQANNLALESTAHRINLSENNVYAAFVRNIFTKMQINIGTRLGVYVDGDGMAHYSIDPSVMLSQNLGNAELSISYAIRHQNLFQTGCSAVSLPTEFWYAANNTQKPQFSHGFMLSAQSLIFDGKISLSAETYYKIMKHQTEYFGTLLDLVTTDYNIDNQLVASNGYNYGFSLMINKRAGKIKGWAGYSYGRAWREGDFQSARFPATHERPHEVNIVVTYAPTKRLEFGGTWVYASGMPFTAPTHFYLLNGNLMMQYGNHNANRTRPYMRLDLSANLSLRHKKRFEDGINFSVYNVLGRANEVYFTLKYYDGDFKFRHVSFLVNRLPNISYYLKF